MSHIGSQRVDCSQCGDVVWRAPWVVAKNVSGHFFCDKSCMGLFYENGKARCECGKKKRPQSPVCPECAERIRSDKARHKALERKEQEVKREASRLNRKWDQRCQTLTPPPKSVEVDMWEARIKSAVNANRHRRPVRVSKTRRVPKGPTTWEAAFKMWALKPKEKDPWTLKCESVASNQRKRMRRKRVIKSQQQRSKE